MYIYIYKYNNIIIIIIGKQSKKAIFYIKYHLFNILLINIGTNIIYLYDIRYNII